MIEVINNTQQRISQKMIQQLAKKVVQAILKNKNKIKSSQQKSVKKINIKLRNPALLKKDLTIVLVTAAQMRKINYQYRGKNKVTDILSFSSVEELRQNPGRQVSIQYDPGSMGELVLCIPQIKKQAKEHGLTFQQELTYMLLHGVLHLLGYDHEASKKEEKLMFSIQDAIFESIFH